MHRDDDPNCPAIDLNVPCTCDDVCPICGYSLWVGSLAGHMWDEHGTGPPTEQDKRDSERLVKEHGWP